MKYRCLKLDSLLLFATKFTSLIDTIITDMIENVQPGRYVVAVSGGVDSIVLLDILNKQPDVRLTVAHFDHGIRPDSYEDRRFVQELARKYQLPFVYGEGHLGEDASEDVARKKRYEFLHAVRKQADARAVVTAHHEDDVLETMLLNLLRGTNRKGLSSLRSTDVVLRPLLQVPKLHITAYANKNNLSWREDSTNTNLRYRRNFVRHQLVPKLTMRQRNELIGLYKRMLDLNKEIDEQLANHLHVQPHAMALDRAYFARLPHKVAMEVMAAWLRRSGVRDFTSQGLVRLVVASKTALPNRIIDVNGKYYIRVDKTCLALTPHDR